MRYGFVGAFAEAAATAQEIGATGLPLMLNPLQQKSPEGVTAPLRAAGMAACQIGCWQYNPLQPDQAAQAAQQALLLRCIPLAAALGCPYFVINSGNYGPGGFAKGHPDNFTDHALDEVAKALEAPLALAEEHGARLVIEPMVHCVVSTPERFRALQRRVASPTLRINLDLCNFFTLADCYAPTPAVERLCGELAGEYDLVHCKDLQVSQGVHAHIDEAPLGTGVVDWATALGRIDLPDDGWFIYEHVRTAEDARAGDAALRQWAAQAGVALGRPSAGGAPWSQARS